MKMLMTLFTFIALCSSLQAKNINLNPQILDNSQQPFIERAGALAMNIDYTSIPKARLEISKEIKKKLIFFDKWNIEGEAHITVITPPDYSEKLQAYVSIDEINDIAKEFKIQSSDLQILGIGSGKKLFKGQLGETFFLIAKSERLLKIRERVFRLYAKNGGPLSGVKAFNPKNFYPHITIGFTHDDIHETDGLIKDVAHSLDSRFNVVIPNPKLKTQFQNSRL